MNVNTEVKPTDKKDHYHLYINGVDMGVWERNQLRQHIGDIDNAIT